MREVAAPPPHHLDDVAALFGDGGLLDLVHDRHDVVEGGVGADAQLGAREVVVDGRRQADDRDVEGREVRPLLEQPVRARVRLPAADDEQPVDGRAARSCARWRRSRARPARRATCPARRRPSAPSRSRSSSPSRRGRRPPGRGTRAGPRGRRGRRRSPGGRPPGRRRSCPGADRTGVQRCPDGGGAARRRGGWGSAFSSVLNVRSASLKLGATHLAGHASKSRASSASLMRRESATHSSSGIRTTRLPRMPMTSDCASAAPESSVSMAA